MVPEKDGLHRIFLAQNRYLSREKRSLSVACPVRAGKVKARKDVGLRWDGTCINKSRNMRHVLNPHHFLPRTATGS